VIKSEGFPVFSATRSFRNHSNMMIFCSRNISRNNTFFIIFWWI